MKQVGGYITFSSINIHQEEKFMLIMINSITCFFERKQNECNRNFKMITTDSFSIFSGESLDCFVG